MSCFPCGYTAIIYLSKNTQWHARLFCFFLQSSSSIFHHFSMLFEFFHSFISCLFCIVSSFFLISSLCSVLIYFFSYFMCNFFSESSCASSTFAYITCS